MGYAYKITDQQGLYYITCTVKDWIDIFTRNEYRLIITDSQMPRFVSSRTLKCGLQFRYGRHALDIWNEEDYEWSSAGYFYKKKTAVTLSFYNG